MDGFRICVDYSDYMTTQITCDYLLQAYRWSVWPFSRQSHGGFVWCPYRWRILLELDGPWGICSYRSSIVLWRRVSAYNVSHCHYGKYLHFVYAPKWRPKKIACLCVCPSPYFILRNNFAASDWIAMKSAQVTTSPSVCIDCVEIELNSILHFHTLWLQCKLQKLIYMCLLNELFHKDISLLFTINCSLCRLILYEHTRLAEYSSICVLPKTHARKRSSGVILIKVSR